MVAGRDDVDTVSIQFLGNLGRDAGAAGGVFTVGDNEIRLLLAAQARDEFADGAPARFANDVTDKKNLHRPKLGGAAPAIKESP